MRLKSPPRRGGTQQQAQGGIAGAGDSSDDETPMAAQLGMSVGGGRGGARRRSEQQPDSSLGYVLAKPPFGTTAEGAQAQTSPTPPRKTKRASFSQSFNMGSLARWRSSSASVAAEGALEPRADGLGMDRPAAKQGGNAQQSHSFSDRRSYDRGARLSMEQSIEYRQQYNLHTTRDFGESWSATSGVREGSFCKKRTPKLTLNANGECVSTSGADGGGSGGGDGGSGGGGGAAGPSSSAISPRQMRAGPSVLGLAGEPIREVPPWSSTGAVAAASVSPGGARRTISSELTALPPPAPSTSLLLPPLNSGSSCKATWRPGSERGPSCGS